ncbi:cation channel sperm-associated auxiliary subunit epsilon [Liasis olivaceus]
MAGFLILLSLLHCLWWSGCGAVWRYRTSTGTYLIFSTRTTIYLEYEGTAFSKWDVPSLCTIDDATEEKTTLFCPVPGTHRVQPVVTAPSSDDEERYLSVNADVNCFMWYIYQNENRLLDSNPTQHIKIWLFDPENADTSEELKNATLPPTYSGTLSRQFWNLGQVPTVRTLFGNVEYSSRSFENGVWSLDLPSQTNDSIATIHGKIVTFQDCFVLDTPFTIAQPIYILGSKTGVSVTLPSGSEAIISWSACYPRSAVVVTDVGIFHTSNRFLSTVEIKFPTGLINSSMIHKVKEVAIVFPNVFILIEKTLYAASVGNVINVGQDYFPGVEIIGIQTKTWCSGEYPLIERKLSEIIIWSEDEVFLGYSENNFYPLTDTTLLRQQLKLKRTANLLIVSACYDSLTTTIAILLECTGCIRTKILYLAAYTEDTAQWILRDFTLGLPTAGAIHMEVILSAITSMVLWDDDTVFYTYKENREYGYLQVSGTKRKFSAASESSTIHQIIIDYSGNAIIKLKNNVLFFFKFEMTDVVKLIPWENNLKHFIFYFNPSGDMYLLTINHTKITRQVYPLKLEVLSVASKLKEVCPYISFEHNLNLNIHYIDMGENVTFWGQIVFLENLGLSVDVEINRPELLKTKTYINYEIARGICTKNMTLTFYHERDYSELEYYRFDIESSRGIMTVEFQPSESGKTCISKSKLSHICIGCPPGKEIIVASFCKLSTYFAVQTYGIIERPNWMQVAGWVTMLVTVFWGFLVFSYFRYVKIFRSFPFVDPLQSLSPNVHAAKPDDELKKD